MCLWLIFASSDNWMALVLTSSVVCVICFGDWMCHFFLCPFSSIRVYYHKSCQSTKLHGFFKWVFGPVSVAVLDRCRDYN